MEERELLRMIGSRIRGARKLAKLNQAQLAKKVGYSMNGIAKIERGETEPKLSVLYLIAAVLHMDISDLVTTRRGVAISNQNLFTQIFDRVVKEYLAQADEESKEQFDKD